MEKININNLIPLGLGKNFETAHSQTFCHYNSSIQTWKSLKSNDSEKNEEDFPWNGLTNSDLLNGIIIINTYKKIWIEFHWSILIEISMYQVKQ